MSILDSIPSSLRSKLFLLLTATILFTAVTIMTTVSLETNKAMMISHETGARNLMKSVVLTVETEYKSLLFHKEATLERRKLE